MSEQPYTTVIGLEVHVQLSTESKLFCRCNTKFGAEPNTQTCPVCIGMPGSLPVMNRRAYELSLKTAVALNCTIPEFTKWDRKQYYYPDLPKGYQISQFDLPMSADGYLEISDPKDKFAPKRVGIIRAHLEEDAGKSVHDEAAGKADSEIDLNRTGTPLLEIVSQPDMRSAAEAKAFLQELKLLLTYIDVSDCNMQEGSLRVDANVNLHIEKDGKVIATPIVEIKNMNSFRAVERALEYEAPRQYREWQETGRQLGEAPKQTRGWDDVAGVTRGQRSKEESSDYRYFPDPDLAPVITSAAEVDVVRESLGELPADLRRRLSEGYSLSLYDADVIVNQGREFADYYLAVAGASGNPKSACNWVTGPLQRELKEREQTIDSFGLPAQRLAELIRAVDDGRLPSTRAPEAFQLMVDKGSDVAAALAELKIERVDETALVTLVQELLAANPKTVSDIQNGKFQAAASLIGQAKKKNPNVDPNRVRELAIELATSLQ
ncbi:Asp-tRNA(Asn)/Glu-tRNA(Gln) amidotransferase subunit GatB [Lacipirellula limnantheis]|uniref:Aspartyl/glutamyl-tRNA(Asn/Gln) amidotransferase subunit B n=1 Tax=Lacipirellula limnantheis TaxID=2528024 RepID=A0A517U041_9BACT|nr:Asp-tRNA(Asn)/Glu-tRNA(Gln) amidotransferase subunit GatB [Lacipirellula limnantheis]QDT73973.1 Aspartyl/glutamyl-tRNA(Asn/Gln) amidotransferase subunit B [Lacipirellula limnantheis]